MTFEIHVFLTDGTKNTLWWLNFKKSVLDAVKYRNAVLKQGKYFPIYIFFA